ncbi:unnamed protein product [Colias eurytheme]|nr:unnamed protein product [Colias eurytheme]
MSYRSQRLCFKRGNRRISRASHQQNESLLEESASGSCQRAELKGPHALPPAVCRVPPPPRMPASKG